MNTKKFKADIVTTIIGEDVFVKGSIHTQRSVKIEGSFEGEINSKSEVFIGPKSKVKATIIAKRIIVAGEIIGDIEASSGINILNTGKVFGNISGDQLNIEEGAIYKGSVNMDIISSKSIYEGDVILNLNEKESVKSV